MHLIRSTSSPRTTNKRSKTKKVKILVNFFWAQFPQTEHVLYLYITQMLNMLVTMLTYLFWLVHSLLRVRLHLVVRMICHLGDWLLEDGCCLSNW